MKLRARTAIVTFVALGGLLGAGTALWASHQFDDVSSGHFYHADVTALHNAGITNGCDENSYCPTDPTSRGNMAAFLHRGLGRTAFGNSTADLASGVGVPASVSIKLGGVNTPGTAQHGFVLLEGAVTVYASGDVSSCPCEIEAFVYRLSDGRQGPSMWSQLPAGKTAAGNTQVSVPVSWVDRSVPGRTVDYGIAVYVNSGTPEGAVAEASLSATYVPFGSSGTKALAGDGDAVPPRPVRSAPGF